MDNPVKFNGMTDEQVGAYLNTDPNIENLIASEISWLLLNKPAIIDLIDFDHLENFNEKIESTDFNQTLTPTQIVSIVNNPDLTKIEKTGTVEVLEGNITVNTQKTIKLKTSSLSGSISSSASGVSGATSLLSGSNFINEIIGVVTILDLVVNEVPKIPTLLGSFSQNLNSIFSGLYDDIAKMSKGLTDFKYPDLANSTDPGFGFTNSLGGTNGTGTAISYGGNQQPAGANSDATITGNRTTPDTTVYSKLEDTINSTLRQDWRTKNAKPGNPLILTAYALSGRNYDKDGTTGEYAWATAFVNWVLHKSGIDYMKVMSPMAYAGYGNPVTIGTFKSVRKNDLIILSSIHGIGHIGFIRAYDPKTNQVTILGGNQAGTVKLTKISVSRSDPDLYVSHIRRNWTIPTDQDVPLFQSNPLPTRPGQQTSGNVFPTSPAGGPTRLTPESTAERIDRLSGNGSSLA